MKKIITIVAASLALIHLNSCEKINGKGPVVSEIRTVATFSKIESEFPGDLILVQGAVQEVKAQAQENIIGDLYTTVSNGILKIKMKDGLRLSTGNSLKVYVTIPLVERLSLMGSGNIEVNEGIESNNLDLKLTGSGNLNISEVESEQIYSELTGSGNIKIEDGNTNTLTLKLTGSGDFKAENLNCNDANVTITGSGSATVRVKNKLNATISGSGNINYYGNPTVTESISGSGRVKKKG